ncbi:invasion associated locus B family protein [Methylobacterium sp. Leaf456]|uniref:invasion associated locus B family protein n=1 Tax=Methylobacterium sp. Leaf456 TaxID=1736382 RepID=UPI00138F19C2|nr:invasion associated locus B family protein [Methylobacterium sp. Leaf456]
MAASLLGSIPAAAQLRGSLPDGEVAVTDALPPRAGFRLKPTEGAPTDSGVRRVIQTFAGWTLICDEAKRTRVCNVSQTILDHDGAFAFSWSLAATSGGEPVFVVRAPVMDFPAHTVTVAVESTETVIRLDRCDARLCLGFLPLDAALVKGIKNRGSAAIRYRIAEGARPVTFTTSLDGLKAAMASLR